MGHPEGQTGAPAAQCPCPSTLRGTCTQWATTGAPDASRAATSARRGSGTQGTNPGAPAAQRRCSSAPRGSCASGPPLGPVWSRAPGAHAHGNAERQVVDGLRTEVCGQQKQLTPTTTNTTSRCQLLGAADAQTARHAISSTAPAHQPLGSADAETTPAGAPAAPADRKQRPDATCEGTNG